MFKPASMPGVGGLFQSGRGFNVPQTRPRPPLQGQQAPMPGKRDMEAEAQKAIIEQGYVGEANQKDAQTIVNQTVETVAQEIVNMQNLMRNKGLSEQKIEEYTFNTIRSDIAGIEGGYAKEERDEVAARVFDRVQELQPPEAIEKKMMEFGGQPGPGHPELAQVPPGEQPPMPERNPARWHANEEYRMGNQFAAPMPGNNSENPHTGMPNLYTEDQLRAAPGDRTYPKAINYQQPEIPPGMPMNERMGAPMNDASWQAEDDMTMEQAMDPGVAYQQGANPPPMMQEASGEPMRMGPGEGEMPEGFRPFVPPKPPWAGKGGKPPTANARLEFWNKVREMEEDYLKKEYKRLGLAYGNGPEFKPGTAGVAPYKDAIKDHGSAIVTLRKLKAAWALAQAGIYNEAGAGLKTFAGTWLGERGDFQRGDSRGAGFLPDRETALRSQEYNNIMSLESLNQMASTLKGSTSDMEMQNFLAFYRSPSSSWPAKMQALSGLIENLQNQLNGATEVLTNSYGVDPRTLPRERAPEIFSPMPNDNIGNWPGGPKKGQPMRRGDILRFEGKNGISAYGMYMGGDVDDKKNWKRLNDDFTPWNGDYHFAPDEGPTQEQNRYRGM